MFVQRQRYGRSTGSFMDVCGLALALSIGTVMPAAAVTCSKTSVVAISKPGYFRFAAAKQAQSAWSTKVALMQGLGPAYSRWAMARDSKVTCREIARRYRCVAVADPCR